MTDLIRKNYKNCLLLIGILCVLFPFFNKNSYKNASSIFLYNGYDSYFIFNNKNQIKLEFTNYRKQILWFHNTNTKKANGEINLKEFVKDWNNIFKDNKAITAINFWDREFKEKTVLIARLSNPTINQEKLSFDVDNINQALIPYNQNLYKTTLFIS